MAFRPTFKLDGHKELQRALVKLRGQDIDSAFQTGLRRATKPIPGYMARSMAKFYSAAQRELKNKISAPFQKGLEVHIKSEAKPISGRLFKPLGGVRHRDRKNVSIKVFKGGSRKPRRRGFRSPLLAKAGPFVRDGDARLPVSKVMGPSFHSAFTGGKFADQILDNTEKLAAEKLEKAVLDALRAKSRGFIS